MAYKKTNNKVATYGEQSDSVMELQKQLNAKGASLAVDGKYGDLTKAAFEKFNSASQPTNPSTIPVGAISGEIKPLELAPKAPMTRMQQLLDNEAQNAISGLTGAQQKVAGQESQYSDILKALGTEQQFTNKQLDEQGVTAGQKRLAELQALAMRETNNLTSSILRNESNAIGTRETANFLGSQEARMRRESAINSLAIASEAAMVQGQTELAQANVDRMVKAVYEPMKMELEAARFNLSRLDKNVLEPAQRAKAEATERKLNYELKQVEKQQSFADTLFKNGAPPSLIKEVLNTNSLEEAMQVKGASNYVLSQADKLDLQLKGLQIKKVRQELADGSVKEATIIPKALPNGKVDVVDELAQAVAFGGEKVPSAAAAVGVLSGIQKIAGERASGVFKGVAPIRIATGIRGETVREERITNKADFASLDLKVQQWASGAALTKDQERKVRRMVPDRNDTDFAIQKKLNNLTSYMQTQAKSELATRGITFNPSKVDWFSESTGIGLNFDESGNIVVGDTGIVDNASFFGE